MRFGHFDDKNREYVIERPDTPASWSNYLGTTEYGAIITNNAGGYSFYKSAADGRFLRLRFNAVPLDQPGRYFYIRDDSSGDYWSASWQPVGKSLDHYKSVCRHGTAYTIIDSEYSGINTQSTYFVPLDQLFEYWALKITNTSAIKRTLSLFTYAELASHWNISADLINLQYSQYLIKGDWLENFIQVVCSPNSDSTYTWMTLEGAEIVSFDTQREAFLGSPYRGYHNPGAVEAGQCSNSLAHGDNGCASLHSRIELSPGESREIVVMLGINQVTPAIRTLAKAFGDPARVKLELERVKQYWHGQLGNFTVQSPDADFDHMINVWNAYNCLITYSWSRSGSLIYNGERDGLGFRDTVQDILGVIPLIADQAGERLRLMLTGQMSTGGAMPLVKPFDHQPGHIPELDPVHYRSDDCMWFFNTVPAYVAETGSVDFYSEVLPYADKGEATVYGHLKRAIEFNLERTGKNGLPAGLHADWNDCVNLGYNGETLFVTFQVRYALRVFAETAVTLGKTADAAWAEAELAALDEKICRLAWDGKWFIRAIYENGNIWGSQKNKEGAIFLNTQSWSVISGAADTKQAESAMQAVYEHLYTEYGLMLLAPPFVYSKRTEMGAVCYNTGMKENAGIFCHPQGWAVMAECILGHGDRAYRYYRNFMPAAYNDRAEIRVSEPYVHAQSSHARYSRKFGTTRLPWLTGSAAWAYYSGLQYILGIRPDIRGLVIDPCIPSSWEGFQAKKKFRGCWITIKIKNPHNVCKGVKELSVNGKRITGNMVPLDMIRTDMQVEAVLG